MTRGVVPEKPADTIGAKIVVYAGPGVELSVPFDRERDIWASQAQIEEFFGIAGSNVSRHIHKVFDDDEVDRESNSLRITQRIAEGAGRPETYYSLDFILAAGYRANSALCTERQ